MRAYLVIVVFFLRGGLFAQDAFTIIEESVIHISEDTICVGETIQVEYVGVLDGLPSWDFGGNASFVANTGYYDVTYNTAGLKQITLSIAGTEVGVVSIFVEAMPEAKLKGGLATGIQSVFHYGLALEANPIPQYQTGTWYIQSGETENTGFVGDVTADRIGFYNFDYTKKKVCRLVQSSSGSCVADEACVQLTRYDCDCPIPIERERTVCISDTQVYVQENCCFNPVPEIGDSTYWESQNNTPFLLSSPISIITKITKPGNYKYTFHFVNNLLEQVEDYEGDFKIKVKNNALEVDIVNGDSIGTCGAEITLNGVGNQEGEFSWILESANASLNANGETVFVTPVQSPSTVTIALELDNEACNPVYDIAEVHFIGVFPEVKEQSITISSLEEPIQLMANPSPDVNDVFVGQWYATGLATIDQEGWVNNLIEGENKFYYTISQPLCESVSDTVTINLSPVVTDVYNIENESISFYPNPVKEELHIVMEQRVSSTVFIEVYDFIGNLIQSSQIEGESGFSVDFSQIKSGIYLVSIQHDGSSSQFKVVK